MAKNIQAIRGMNDYLPGETALWQRIEGSLKQVLGSYGYSEIRLPIVEQTPLFKRAIGEVTDVVEKEMYTFEDRNGDSLTLRPEGTAGCVRAGIEHGLLYNQEQRLWYVGPMFRHERPQKGRYRQFHQIGAEVFGLQGPDIDAELIMLTARWWRELGISEHVSLGAELHRFAGSARQLPRRAGGIHWSSLPINWMKTVNAGCIPTRCGCWTPKTRTFRRCSTTRRRSAIILTKSRKPTLPACARCLTMPGSATPSTSAPVRGLDYYNRTVFEWVTTSLGSRGHRLRRRSLRRHWLSSWAVALPRAWVLPWVWNVLFYWSGQ